MLTTLKRGYARSQSLVFKNQIGIVANLNHLAYDALVRARSRGKSFPDEDEAARLRRDGYLVVPDAVGFEAVTRMQAIIDRLYASGASDRQYHDAGLLRVSDCLLHMPELLEVVEAPPVKNVIEAYYRGHFRLYNVDAYRTFPRPGDASFGSQQWHFDSVPPSMLKIMLCLTDVSRETGAMQLVRRPVSLRLRKAGFLNRTDAPTFEQEIRPGAIPMEGKAGSVIFFLPQYAIHRAPEPEHGHRDVAVYMFHSALAPYHRPETEEERLRISNQATYIQNPFTGTSKEAVWLKHS